MWGTAPHIFRILKLHILKFFNFSITSRIHWKRCFGCDFGTNPQNSALVKISIIFKFSSEFYNNCCFKGMKRKLCRTLFILRHFKMSGVIWIFGGFEISSDLEISRNSQHFSYYVPSMCFMKARKWYIETVETASESSEPVLSE